MTLVYESSTHEPLLTGGGVTTEDKPQSEGQMPDIQYSSQATQYMHTNTLWVVSVLYAP